MILPWIRYVREGLYPGPTELPRTPLEPPNVRRSSSWVALGVLTSSKPARRSDNRLSPAVLPLFLELQVQGPACQRLLPECRVGKGGCFDWGTLPQPRDVPSAQQSYDQVCEQDVRMMLLMV